jgi:hypothetical protein
MKPKQKNGDEAQAKSAIKHQPITKQQMSPPTKFGDEA